VTNLAVQVLCGAALPQDAEHGAVYRSRRLNCRCTVTVQTYSAFAP
jgi:hypothetical protein